MPGQVIGKQMNYGYPGQISRVGDEVSRTFAVKSGTDKVYFGNAVKLNTDGSCQLLGAGDTAVSFAGVAMRRVKSALEYPNQNNGYYLAEEACDVLQRGSVMVECVNGTPAITGDVYVYITAANNHNPGEFSAVADGANTVKLTNAKWATTTDARNVAEITIMTRQGV